MSDYKLKLVDHKYIFRVYITADMHDGDSLTSVQSFEKGWFEIYTLPEIQELKKIVGKRGALEEYDRERHIIYQELGLDIPDDTLRGEPCHTLKEISVEFIDADGRLYEVII
ncbi:hypothetical protein BSP36_196 [Bacillus phage BSP36]|nr:hypothetical protein BSP36_196 [Bacillus phage BSP36]